jgi:hypothetical protein
MGKENNPHRLATLEPRALYLKLVDLLNLSLTSWLASRRLIPIVVVSCLISNFNDVDMATECAEFSDTAIIQCFSSHGLSIQDDLNVRLLVLMIRCARTTLTVRCPVCIAEAQGGFGCPGDSSRLCKSVWGSGRL